MYSKLDLAINNFKIAEIIQFLNSQEVQSQITERTLNLAILKCPWNLVDKLLTLGATPNEDSLLCALFSKQPHYIISKLLDKGTDTAKAKMHVEYSNQPHFVRSKIKGAPVLQISVSKSKATIYANENLKSLFKKYQDIDSIKKEIAINSNKYWLFTKRQVNDSTSNWLPAEINKRIGFFLGELSIKKLPISDEEPAIKTLG